MRINLYLLITVAILLISQYGMGQPRAVDLGLSVKWASCNLGANAPEEYGNYYAWGEMTSTKRDYYWSTYKWCKGNEDLNKYCTDSEYGTVDNKTVLAPGDDAAHLSLGGKWRMPTAAEWDELIEECKWIWTTQGGKNGYKVTSKTNGKSIFLPAAGFRYDYILDNAGSYGYYWSSSLNTDDPCFAYEMYFYSTNFFRGSGRRYLGLSVRPVTE